MTDLARAYHALTDKQPELDKLWSYYDGNQPLKYSTERLRKLFQKLDARFSTNWCEAVIGAMVDRIDLERFDVRAGESVNQPLTDRLNELWQLTEMNLDEDDAHLAALVTGESYVIAWQDADGRPQAWYNDPRLCHLFYDPANPHRKAFGAKWWVDEEGKRRITLYYPDRMEYYISSVKSDNVSSAKSFERTEENESANPYGIVPMFHLRRERRVIKSELANVLEPQDAINKLMADMMASAEFGAFPQRYIITSAAIEGRLKNAPNEIWALPAGDGMGQATSAGQFGATSLGNYLEAIDRLVSAVAAITRTPRHYFYHSSGDPSGEALIAMEAPLTKKVHKFIDRCSPVWREVAAFLLLLDGVTVDAVDIEPVYENTETVQPLTRSLILQNLSGAGAGIEQAALAAGFTEEMATTLGQADIVPPEQ